MALALFDRVQETSTTAGTGSIILAGAVSGFQSFAVVGNGNTCYYTIVDGSAWEVGVGTYSTSGPTLARTTILSNSNGNTSPLTLTANSKSVFLTYPASKSVNLNESGNVSPLGTVVSGIWNGTTIGVAYGGTGVTASSGANSVVLRDSNQNVAVNRVNQANTNTTAAGGTTALTAASSYIHTLVGTGGQTYSLPDATTLTTGVAFVFNNLATGTLTIANYAGTTIGTIPSGGAGAVFLTLNSTVGGTWDLHAYLPEGVTFGTNAFNLGTSIISGGTWQGGTIQTGYGGTGLTSYTSGGAVYANSTTTLTSGTLPITAGGTGNTSGQAASTASSATFNSGGAGDASGTTFNGSAARTISYNTIGAPSTTGTNASGTWGINITGNASSSSYATYVYSQDIRTLSPSSTSAYRLGFGFTSWANNNTAPYADYLALRSYSDASGGNDNLVTFNKSTIAMRVWQQSFGSASAYSSYADVLMSNNYNSYAPTLTGGGASGTWGINITGSAGSAPGYLPLSGGTMTGSLAFAQGANINFGSSTTEAGPWTISVIGSGGATPATKGTGYGRNLIVKAGNSDNGGGLAGGDLYLRAGAPTAPATTYGVVYLSDDGGFTQAGGSLRAPIFYDSNDTSWYVDPNGNSRVAQLGVGSNNTSYTFYNNGTSYLNGAVIVDDVATFNVNGSSTIFITAAGTNASMIKADGGDELYIGGNNTWQMRFSGANVLMDNGGYFLNGESIRSPIFYDSNDTSYYVNPNSTSLLSSLNVYGGGLYDSQTGFRLTLPGGAAYATGASVVSGAIKVRLPPASLGSNTMLGFDVNVYTYDGQSFTIRCGGYNYSDAGKSWINTFAYMLSGNRAALNVRFGWDGSSQCIWIGELGSSWSYPQVGVSNFVGGYSGFNASNFASGWTVSFETSSFYSVSSSWTVYPFPYYSGQSATLYSSDSMRSPIFYDLNNTGYYTDPASTSRMSNINYDNLYFAGDTTYGLIGRNGYLDTVNGRGSDPLELNYYDGGVVKIGSGTNGSKALYASELYSTIFYDSNNTGYYVDAASTSVLGGINVNGTLDIRGGNNFFLRSSNNAYQRADSRDDASDSRTHWYGVTTSGGTSNFRHAWYDGSAYFNVTASGAQISFDRSGGGSVYAAGDFRAPVFYDSNDTGYYLNPNGSSLLYGLVLSGNQYFRPNTWIQMDNSSGIYWPNSSGTPHFNPNSSTYGPMELSGIKNSYSGIRLPSSNNTTIGMFDSSGNGGLYNYSYWIYYWLVGNACLGVRTSSTSSSYAIYVDGGIYSTGNIVAYSDVRKKRNIVTVDNALATVNKLRGVFYNRIETNDEKVDPNKRQLGVIAQEVNEVLPEAVTYAKDVDEYGVQYGNMAGLFIEAIKELTAKIDDLEKRIAA